LRPIRNGIEDERTWGNIGEHFGQEKWRRSIVSDFFSNKNFLARILMVDAQPTTIFALPLGNHPFGLRASVSIYVRFCQWWGWPWKVNASACNELPFVAAHYELYKPLNSDYSSIEWRVTIW
jgi:hypothetical protein